MKFRINSFEFEEEGITRSIIALGLIGAYVYLESKGLNGEFLAGVFGTIVGFYFSKKLGKNE